MRGLSLSRHGHSVVCEGRFFQVFLFAHEEQAEIFREEFGGERMRPFRGRQRRALDAVEKGRPRSNAGKIARAAKCDWRFSGFGRTVPRYPPAYDELPSACFKGKEPAP